MPRRPAKYAETKPQRHVRRDTGQAKVPADPVKQAFEQARLQMTCGFGITRAARDELMFRAGWNAAYVAAAMEAL